MWTLGDRIYSAVGRPTDPSQLSVPEWINLFPISDFGPLGLEVNALLPYIVLLPITLYAAVIVTKLIDTPSVKLSKALFKQQSVKSNTREPSSETTAILPQYVEEQR